MHVDSFRLGPDTHHWPTKDIIFLHMKAETPRDHLFPWRNCARLLQVALRWRVHRDLWIPQSLWVCVPLLLALDLSAEYLFGCACRDFSP